MNAQQTLGVLCKRLLAALSLAVAATLAPLASGIANQPGIGGAATIDQAADIDGLVEDEPRRHADGASGVGHAKAHVGVEEPELAAPLAKTARPSRDVRSPHRPHAARAGLTRAPPLT